MSVYFVHCPETNTVKIGFATNPWLRFTKIQSDAPGELRLLAVEDGGKEREAEIHARFAAHRRRGEWFNYALPIQAHIASLPPFAKYSNRKMLGGALGEWLHKNQVSSIAFAKRVGTSDATVSRMCAGIHIPRKEVMRRIFIETQGAVQPNDFYDLPDLEDRAAA